jgi:hypothetical protein
MSYSVSCTSFCTLRWRFWHDSHYLRLASAGDSLSYTYFLLRFKLVKQTSKDLV